MVNGFYQYIKEAWKKPDIKLLRERMVEWRKQEVVTRLEKPLRLDRARALGYKDKKGIIIVRVRVKRGGHKRPRPNKGRGGTRLHTNKNLRMNYQWIAEQRAAKKFKNLEVLNSYKIGKDGVNYFYEVILVDPMVREIQSDKNLKWLTKKENRNRVFRGLTSSARKSKSVDDK